MHRSPLELEQESIRENHYLKNYNIREREREEEEEEAKLLGFFSSFSPKMS